MHFFRRFIPVFFLLLVSCGAFAAEQEIKKTSLDFPENPSDFEFIRISLGGRKPEYTLSTSSAYQVLDAQGRVLFSGPKFKPTLVRASAKGIEIGPQFFSENPVTLVSEKGTVKVNDKKFRHAVRIWKDSPTALFLVNEIPIEDYLKGVLPKEISPTWPPEALKTQAVAARTYALFKAIENQKERAVLSPDVLSQVYGGQAAEHPAATRAVELTRGQVLTYNGKIFPGYFHSTCGGATTHAEYIWPVEPHPSLKGVKCNFCYNSKHYRWSAEFKRSEIEAKLAKQGIKVPGLKNIEPVDLDETERAKSFQLTWSGGKTKIHSNDFRIWLDPMRLKSNRIKSVSKNGDTFVFEGRGWGHGVGLCQFGMKQLAELGYFYQDILKYYYPGSRITKIKPATGKQSTVQSWYSKALSFISGDE